MSVVTNVILTCYITDNLSEVTYYNNQWFLTRVRQCGGSKHLEAQIHIAALNHWSLEMIGEALKTLEFEYPEDVRIFIQEQDDDFFKEYVLSDFEPLDRSKVYETRWCKARYIDDFWMIRRKNSDFFLTYVVETSRELRILMEAFDAIHR